jgi:hypothetical protein
MQTYGANRKENLYLIFFGTMQKRKARIIVKKPAFKKKKKNALEDFEETNNSRRTKITYRFIKRRSSEED